jgi:MFS family permease
VKAPPAQGVTRRAVSLGLRSNLAQFSLLVAVNALVGGMVGQERTVLPLLATEEFGLTAVTATLTFIAVFGIVKAGTNFLAGTLCDNFGRKPVLVWGWMIGLPVPCWSCGRPRGPGSWWPTCCSGSTRV